MFIQPKEVTWWEGRYFDLWSFVHVCSGTAVVLAAFKLGLTEWHALTAVLILSILWEFFEAFSSIREFTTNRMTDIVVTSAGFLPALFAFPYLERFDMFWQWFIVLLVCIALLNYLGWRAYKRRSGEL